MLSMSNSFVGAKTGGIVVLVKKSLPHISYVIDSTSTFIDIEFKC